MALETRVRRLEWWNRALLIGMAAVLAYGFARSVPAKSKIEQLVRAERLEIVDKNGNPGVMLGFDEQQAPGLYIQDPAGEVRVALAHDESGSALFLRDAEGVIRVGVAQFSHGGGGVALHGPASQGAAVLYFKEKGTLTFYDPTGEPILQLPSAKAGGED